MGQEFRSSLAKEVLAQSSHDIVVELSARSAVTRAGQSASKVTPMSLGKPQVVIAYWPEIAGPPHGPGHWLAECSCYMAASFPLSK